MDGFYLSVCSKRHLLRDGQSRYMDQYCSSTWRSISIPRAEMTYHGPGASMDPRKSVNSFIHDLVHTRPSDNQPSVIHPTDTFIQIQRGRLAVTNPRPHSCPPPLIQISFPLMKVAVCLQCHLCCCIIYMPPFVTRFFHQKGWWKFIHPSKLGPGGLRCRRELDRPERVTMVRKASQERDKTSSVQ